MNRRLSKLALAAGVAMTLALSAGQADAAPTGFNLPVQDLSSALIALGQGAGRTILFSPDVVAGKHSGAVAAAPDFNTALREVLAGTNLTYRVTAEGVTIQAARPRAPADKRPRRAVEESDAAPDPSGAEVGEVIVTARKRAERMQDVPIAMTAVSGASLNAGEHLRIEDLNQLAPSTNIVIPNAHQTSFSIRGLGTNPSNDGLEQSAGVFLDGVYLGRPGMAVLDLVDISQIELLRGPQGTLFGKNTTAGAVVITTTAPSFTPGGTLQVSGGNLGYAQAQGTVTGPLIDGVLAGRLTAYVTSRNGWVRDTTDGRNLDGLHRDGIRGQLLFTPTDNFRLRLIGEHHEENDSDGPAVVFNSAGITPAAWQKQLSAVGARVDISPRGDESAINGPLVIRTRQNALTADAEWNLGELTLTSITGWRNWSYRSSNDSDGSDADVIIGGYNVHDDQFSQEFRVATPKDKPVELVAGAYFFDQHIKPDQVVQYGADAASYLAGIPNSLLPVYAPFSAQLRTLLAYNGSQWDIWARAHTQSYALFSQGTWHATPQLDVTLGLRGTYEKKTETVWRPNPISQSTGAPIAALASQAYPPLALGISDWAPSGLISVDYKLQPNVMLYASATQGEKAGGLSTTLPTAGIGPDSLVVKPEIAQGFEFGLKSEWLDRRVLLNLSAFYTKVRDYQATFWVTPPGAVTAVQVLTNVGRVRTSGVELEAAAKPIDGLTLNFTGSFNDATYAAYPNGPCAAEIGGTSCDLTGRPVAGAPRWIANVSGYYEHPILDGVSAYAGLEYSWRSSFYAYLDDSAQAKSGDYGLLNLRLGAHRDDGRWDVTAWAKNLTDERYVTSYSAGGAFVPGVYEPVFGDPRTYGITLRTSF